MEWQRASARFAPCVRHIDRVAAFDIDDRSASAVGDGPTLGGSTQYAPLSAFVQTE